LCWVLSGWDLFLPSGIEDDLSMAREYHGWGGLRGCTAQVPSGTASGRDITAHTSPAPVPWVVQVFSHALVIVTFTPLPNEIVDHFQIARRGSLSDWPSLSMWTMALATFQVSAFSGLLSRFKLAVVDNVNNTFGCLSSFSLFFTATSSRQLQNRISPFFTFSCLPPTIFHGNFRISCRTCMSGGMDSQWIVSRRHQVCKYVLFLVTSSLHVSRSPYPIYAAVAAPHFFVLWHKECAVIHSFSHHPLPPRPVS
jgi:hypothetical protein